MDFDSLMCLFLCRHLQIRGFINMCMRMSGVGRRVVVLLSKVCPLPEPGSTVPPCVRATSMSVERRSFLQAFINERDMLLKVLLLKSFEVGKSYFFWSPIVRNLYARRLCCIGEKPLPCEVAAVSFFNFLQQKSACLYFICACNQAA